MFFSVFVIPGKGADTRLDMNREETQRETAGQPRCFWKKIVIIKCVIVGV